jgi:hypothetical protein
MKNAKQLAARFSEIFMDGKWIANTNYQEQLADITCEQANRQIGSLNTIALLTFHVNYYIAGVLNVLKGGALEIRDKYSFDTAGVHSEAEWANLKNELYNNAAQFAQHVERLSDEQLAQAFVKAEYGDYHRNINGLIEHSYYHLGQISLLKKLILESE